MKKCKPFRKDSLYRKTLAVILLISFFSVLIPVQSPFIGVSRVSATSNGAASSVSIDEDKPVFNLKVLHAAIQEPLKYGWELTYGTADYQKRGGYATNRDGPAGFVYHALYAYYYPNTVFSGFNVTEELRKKIETLVQPNGRNEPPSAGGVQSGWYYAGAAQGLILAKFTPSVWDNLSDDVKFRCDLLMKALTISSNFMIHPLNAPMVHPCGVNGGVYSAPNMFESANAIYQLAYLYFGSVEAMNEVITTTITDPANPTDDTKYNAFLQQLKDNGLMNIYDQWNYQIVKDNLLGITTTNNGGPRYPNKISYIYGAYNPITSWSHPKDRQHIPQDKRISTPYESWPMYRETANWFFPFEVKELVKDAGYPAELDFSPVYGPSDPIQVVYGRVIDPAYRDKLPNKGEIGMAWEFGDASPTFNRSSLTYVTEGLLPMLSTSFVLKALSSKMPELWPTKTLPDEVAALEKRIKVGVTDVIFKAEHGYMGFDMTMGDEFGTPKKWRDIYAEFAATPTAAEEAMAKSQATVIGRFIKTQVGFDYTIGAYKAMFENSKGHAYNADIRTYSDYEATIPVDTRSLNIGDSFTAVVEVDAISGIKGVDIALKYNPAMVEVDKVLGVNKVSSLLPEMTVLIKDNLVDAVNGKIRFSAALKGFTGDTSSYMNKKIYKVGFKVKQTGDYGIGFDNTTVQSGLMFVDAGNNSFVAKALDNAALAGLTLSKGTLSPLFAADRYNYTASVGGGTTSIDITAIAGSDSYKSITINSAAVTSGNPYQASLDLGANTFAIKVTGADDTTKTYTVVVTRTLSPDATLKSLSLSQDKLFPTFAAEKENYTAAVGYEITSLDILPQAASDVHKSIKINSETVASGSTYQASLSEGNNTIAIEVTAEDNTVKTYTIVVTRAGNPDATLKSLSLSEGTLSPEFAPGTDSYTASVGYGVNSIDITAVANSVTHKGITINSATTVSGNPYKANLSVGTNTFTIVVTAADNSTKTYTIDVTRAKDPDATLKSLSLSEGALSPAFVSDTDSYTASVGYGVTSIDITAVANSDTHKGITINTAAAASGNPYKANLSVGTNTFTIVVTAADNSTKTYTVEVTRAKDPDATLKSLSLSEGTLSPAFEPGTDSYTASVAYGVTSIDITAVANSDTHQGITINTAAATSGNPYPVSLSVGNNTIVIQVTAADNSTKTYTLAVTREKDTDATLKSLSLSEGTLSPVFAPDNESYTVSVDKKVKSIDITPVANSDVHKSITINSANVVSGNPYEIDLSKGDNTYTIEVTAQDGTATKKYTVVINRQTTGSDKEKDDKDKDDKDKDDKDLDD